MRPTRITVEGFSAYRSRVDVDLENVEFFALSGPTGSGKSSLVDAMIFALYGRVPRLGARAVAPVITAGADRARVALEFEVDGEGYVASRVAERTDTGASVKEARLEKADGTALANGAGEVTATVESLLRLRFEDFTKTVVLPQGEFARFLNAGSRERRDLLRDLLGLEVYTRMRDLANVRRSVAAERLSSARNQLDALDVPEEDDLAAANDRVGKLEDLARVVDERTSAIDEIESELARAKSAQDALDESIDKLKALEAPDHLGEMEERLAAARKAEELAEGALVAKESEIQKLSDRLGELPSEESLDRFRAVYKEIDELDGRMSDLDIHAAENRSKEHGAAVSEAEALRSEAARALSTARLNHATHAVAASLEVGEPCPVCEHVVEALPAKDPPEELGELERASVAAEEELGEARNRLESSRLAISQLKARHSEISDRRRRRRTGGRRR